MKPVLIAVATAAVCFAMSVTSASAQLIGLSEIRGGVTLDDIDIGNFEAEVLTSPQSITTANVELLLDLFPFSLLGALGEIRPHVGVNFGFNGAASNPQVYAGASWTVTVSPTPVFVEIAAGGAVNADEIGQLFDSENMGCLAEIRGAASLGFSVTPNVRLMATAEHFWPTPLCGGAGAETTNLGVRVGFKF